MKTVDKTVLRETVYISACVLVLSLLTQAIFLVIGRWDYTVLLGNLLGGTGAIANFFLMGLTVQTAVTKDEKDAKQMMKASQGLRTLMLLVVAVLGGALPCFSLWTTLISLFFPRIAILLRPLLNNRLG